MAIPVQCEHCGRESQVGDELAGHRVKCVCGMVIMVPEASEIMAFFSEELELGKTPLSAQNPTEWAEATGAPPEVTQLIEKKIAKKLSSNAGFMMALAGGILGLMLIIGLIAVWLAVGR